MHLYNFLLVTLIPLLSFQHFVPPLSDCLMADYCNHTWVPECGLEGKEGSNTSVYKLFIDQCDQFEYNCDNKRTFVKVNYTECFRPIKCDDKKFLRSGNYKIMLRDRMVIYDPTVPPTTPGKTDTKKRYFFRIITQPTGQGEEIRYTPKEKQWLRVMEKTVNPPRRRTTNVARLVASLRTNAERKKTTVNKNRVTKSNPFPKRKTVAVTTKESTFATLATVVLTKYTVIKDGKKYMKVIKGYPPASTTTAKLDSDYLE